MVLVALLAIAVAMVLSGLIGAVAVVSGVPDIVVTLAASFVLSGLALIVLDGPGGGTHPRFQELLVGGFGEPLPAILLLAAVLGLVWLPFKRSRLGIATYAVGSDRAAAFLSGVGVGRTRVIAYVMAGFFSGLAGVVTTAFTGSGEPRASIGATATLTSVAAVVLGGVALLGGSGTLLGPVLAALCLGLIPALMLGLGWDPNYAEVSRGIIIIVVVMVGGLVQIRGGRGEHDHRRPVPGGARRWSTIALGGVLVVLYVVTGLFAEGMFSANGVRSTLLLACPLAILATSQTLCMLTGGIDLSTVMTANFAAYVAANQSGQGPLVALGLAMLVGLAVGLVNGIGVGVFKVNPLIMTLGMASVLLGVVTVGLVGDGFLSGSTRLLPVVTDVASGTLFGPLPRNLLVWALVAAVLIFGLSRTGLGRTIYAVEDNLACRLAEVRIWQVLLAVYVMSALLAALAGLLFSGISGSVGPDQTSLPAAVGGGGGHRRHLDPRRGRRLHRHHPRRPDPDRPEPAAADPGH